MNNVPIEIRVVIRRYTDIKQSGLLGEGGGFALDTCNGDNGGDRRPRPAQTMAALRVKESRLHPVVSMNLM